MASRETNSEVERHNSTFSAKVSEFAHFYSDTFVFHQEAMDHFTNLLKQLTRDKAFEAPKIVCRIKEKNECIRKFIEKYRQDAEASGDYHIKDFVTDLLGVRIITHYESDIQTIQNIIKSTFDVLRETNKTASLTSGRVKFGYKGIHLDVRLKGSRRELPENARFRDIDFEVQIRSMVQDAWSEVDHKLRYKKDASAAIQRRIVRIAALFEIADEEFSAIKELSSISENNLDVNTATERLNSLALLSVCKFIYPTTSIREHDANNFIAAVRAIDPGFTVNELKLALLADGISPVFEEEVLDPLSRIRNALVNFNNDLFSQMEWPYGND